MSLVDRVQSYSAPEIAVVTFGLTALTAIIVGSLPIAVLEPLVALVPIIGWFILTPLAAINGWGTDDSEPETSQDPVEQLRERFANGEIDEVEFERQLELLVATEDTDPQTARQRIRNQRPVDGGSHEADERAVERE